MRAEFFYTCAGCGQRKTCGDCIPEYCYDCREAIKELHPNPDSCPCRKCQMERLILDADRIKRGENE